MQWDLIVIHSQSAKAVSIKICGRYLSDPGDTALPGIQKPLGTCRWLPTTDCLSCTPHRSLKQADIFLKTSNPPLRLIVLLENGHS